MPLVPDARQLRLIPLFEGLSDNTLDEINTILRKHTFAAGTNVITFQTPGEVLYIILSGTVKIKVDQADGKEVVVALLGAGELVGELSVLDNDFRSADVMTQEKSVLAWIDRDSFRQLMENYPQISQNLLRVLTRRVRLSTEQIMALGTLDVLGKVARQLIVFADQYGQKNELGIVIPLRLTQSEIAGLVGCSRERVNQVFLSLRTQKLISVDNAFRITVRDIEQLRKVLSNR